MTKKPVLSGSQKICVYCNYIFDDNGVCKCGRRADETAGQVPIRCVVCAHPVSAHDLMGCCVDDCQCSPSGNVPTLSPEARIALAAWRGLSEEQRSHVVSFISNVAVCAGPKNEELTWKKAAWAPVARLLRALGEGGAK